MGDLDRRYVFAINPQSWPTSLEEFYTKDYPGVNYQAIRAVQKELEKAHGFFDDVNN